MHCTSRIAPLILCLSFLVLASVLETVTAAAQAMPPGLHGLDVVKVEITGLPADLKRFPRKGLALTPRSRILGTKRMPLTPRALDADRQRIRHYLVRHGFPDAVVTGTATADKSGRRAIVHFEIVAGARVHYGNVATTGVPASLADETRQLLAQETPVAGPFDQDAVERLRGKLLTLLREEGHARPKVEIQVRRDGDAADLSYEVTAGPNYVFGRVNVLGVEPDITSLSERVIGLDPGQRASETRLRDVRRDLRRLNLFRRIDVTTNPVAADTLDVKAKLALQALTTWELSVGTFTDDAIRVSAAWTHRNLFRHGRSLRLAGAYSQYDTEASALTSWPALILRNSRTDLSLKYHLASEDNYEQRTTQAEIASTFEPWRQTSARLGVALSFDEVREDAASLELSGAADGWTPVLRARINRDAVDNPIGPDNGHRATLTTEWSPPVSFSQNPYLSVRGYGSWYRSLGQGTVAAARLDLGIARALGEANELLPSERFFAGGATTMRGYERRRLGPVDSQNEPVGGELVALAGTQVRRQAGRILGLSVGVTAFVDVGQVWSRRQDARLADLKVAAGLGLLVGTPVGPLRFEAARNIGTPMHGDPDLVYHFAIGYPY